MRIRMLFAFLSCVHGQPVVERPVIERKELPSMVLRALDFVPELKPDQVVLLDSTADLKPYLAAWGYSEQATYETIRAVRGFAEFTLDHRFPIFVNTGSWHYRRIVASWENGISPDQAAMVLASDLYHEYRHAACGEGEVRALEAHVRILKLWRAQGLLTIANPYIRSKETELNRLRSAGPISDAPLRCDTRR